MHECPRQDNHAHWDESSNEVPSNSQPTNMNSRQQSPQRNHTRLAVAIVVALVLVSATIIFYVSTASKAPQTSTTMNTCGLLTQGEMDNMAWNGAGLEVPRLNQSAPPWNYRSIYDHIQGGWQTLCQTAAFVSAIQAHGTGSFSSGGGFVNPSNPDDSQAGINVIWTSANCTQYIESWRILIVNGTVIGPTTSIGALGCVEA